jgi:hypothetical protein
MLPERATPADYNAIIGTLADYWGERDMRARHHPMFIHEFGETSLVMRDESSRVTAYLVGFVAPTQVGYDASMFVKSRYLRVLAVWLGVAGRGGVRCSA